VVGTNGGRLVLLRHGETEWSRSHRHTGGTDLPLTPAGEAAASALRSRLAGWSPWAVVVSPLLRARRTAELAGLTDPILDDRLAEWDYGEFEGRTTADVNAERAAAGQQPWVLWRDGAPGGESPDRVGARVDALLADVGELRRDGDVALVAHAHILRVLAARWLGQPVSFGASLVLDVARVSVLGHEHDWPAVLSWNADGVAASA
jgi:probable phosphoglycerate mutase